MQVEGSDRKQTAMYYLGRTLGSQPIADQTKANLAVVVNSDNVPLEVYSIVNGQIDKLVSRSVDGASIRTLYYDAGAVGINRLIQMYFNRDREKAIEYCQRVAESLRFLDFKPSTNGRYNQQNLEVSIQPYHWETVQPV